MRAVDFAAAGASTAVHYCGPGSLGEGLPDLGAWDEVLVRIYLKYGAIHCLSCWSAWHMVGSELSLPRQQTGCRVLCNHLTGPCKLSHGCQCCSYHAQRHLVTAATIPMQPPCPVLMEL